jgi:hypothetical protein
LFAFYSLYRIKNTIYRSANEFLKFKMIKNIYF